MRPTEHPDLGVGTAPGPASGRTIHRVDHGMRPGRFVMQSHALGAPIASPRALIIAAAIAVAVYLLGCRLSD